MKFVIQSFLMLIYESEVIKYMFSSNLFKKKRKFKN